MKRRLYSNALIAFLIMSCICSAEESDTKLLLKTIDYKLDLKIDYDLEKLFGDCELTVLNPSNQPINQIPLLLYRLLTIKSVKDKNNIDIPFSQEVLSIAGWEKIQTNVIKISLNKKINPGEKRTIRLQYEGYLLGYSEAGWFYVKDHIDKKFTIIRTDGFGYPIIGYPTEDDMMAIVGERYNYLINVTIPRGVIVANGGKLIKKIELDKEITYSYESIKPSWRIDIAISDYRLLKKKGNKVFYFKQDTIGAQCVMQDLEKSLNLYTEWFGPLHNYQGYTIIEVPKGYGSQADVTSVLLLADNFQHPDEVYGIYHEMSHQWNVKPLDPRPCRFQSEGLAQFLQYLLAEKLNNEENAVKEAAERYMRQFQEASNKNPKYKTIPISEYGIHDMTNFSYTMGMVVFTIFYEMVGGDQFNKIIGSFYSKYYSTGATLDDFVTHCKEISSVDLTKFFDDWINTTRAINHIIEGKTLDEMIEYPLH